MNIKRIIASILLTLILALSLSACGDKNKKGAGETTGEASSSTPTVSGTVTLPSDFDDGWEGPPVPLD